MGLGQALLGMLALRLALHEGDVLLRALLLDDRRESEEISRCRDGPKINLFLTHASFYKSGDEKASILPAVIPSFSTNSGFQTILITMWVSRRYESIRPRIRSPCRVPQIHGRNHLSSPTGIQTQTPLEFPAPAPRGEEDGCSSKCSAPESAVAWSEPHRSGAFPALSSYSSSRNPILTRSTAPYSVCSALTALSPPLSVSIWGYSAARSTPAGNHEKGTACQRIQRYDGIREGAGYRGETKEKGTPSQESHRNPLLLPLTAWTVTVLGSVVVHL